MAAVIIAVISVAVKLLCADSNDTCASTKRSFFGLSPFVKFAIVVFDALYFLANSLWLNLPV
nr:MAG TPA: hypothetical protein [Caudoviricetes sp.]